ncbi:MAG: hypothetical protein ABR536_04780 [Solirubrobacterales bacterium]
MTLATYGAAALICAASLLIGRAAMRLLGGRELSWLEPSVGLAIMLALCSLAIRLPHRATTTIALIAVVAVAALAILRRQALPGRGALAVGGPVALLVLVFASLPFAASGHVGILGIGVNNDLAGHLHYTSWLLDPTSVVPHNIRNGYPIGPHGLAAAISKGTGMEPLSALLGLLLAVPVLTALSTMSVLKDLRALPRTVAGVLSALPYMAVSTFGIAGFKETIMALLVLGFTLGLRQLSRGEGNRRGALVALGILMAGMLAVYSYPGVAYALAIGLAWAALETVAAVRRGEGEKVRDALRTGARLAVIPLAAALVIGIAELPRVRDFGSSVHDVFDVNSRLRETVSPLEALGTWPSGDFLTGTHGLTAYALFGAVGLVALITGVIWAVRRRELALLSGLTGLALVYLGTKLGGGLYVQAKALGIIAPLLMLIVLRALLAPAETPAQTRPPYLRLAFAAGFIGLAAYSSFLGLRDARVAPRDYEAAQLGRFRALVNDKTVLSLTSDRFTDYYLRGSDTFSPAKFAEELIMPRAGKFERLPVDFDSVVPGALDRFDYALTTTAAYKSAPPPNFTEAGRTKDFILWKRMGKTPLIGVLPEEERPGSVLNCRDPKLRGVLAEARKRGYDTARVQPMSVVGKRLFWSPSSTIENGGRIVQPLLLPKGRWQLSIQYYSPVLDLTVDAAGLHAKLTPTADGGVRFRTDQGPFWALGSVTSDGGPIQVTVRAGGLSGLQKLLGVDQGADIGNVTAARPEQAREIPLRQACGRYVDHYSVGA